MKVKVSPDYEGAGSWETDAVLIAGRWRDESTHVEYPASWCEPIPEITPEPGDIVEVWNNKASRHYVYVYFCAVDNNRHRTQTIDNQKGNYVDWDNCRVLARKPKGFDSDIRDAIENLKTDFYSAETYMKEKAAYERFLSAILGVPYARVGGGKDE